MKALFYNFSKRKFVLKDTSLPKIKDNEVLVKLKNSSPCKTDLYIIAGPLTKKAYNKKEIILGHSFSGIIQKVGKKIKNFKPRERVFGSSFVWCGKCFACKKGSENLCDNRFIFGMEIPGSHQEYIVAPPRAIFHLPKEIDLEQGALISDILALNLHALRKSNFSPKQKILILGLGPVGLTLGMLLKSYNSKFIFAIEPIKYRQKLAKKIFNPKIISKKEIKNLKNIDIVFETSGEKKALNEGFNCLKRGGEMFLIGVQREKFNLNALKLVSREISIYGIFEFNNQDIQKSLMLLKNKKINLKKIITHRFLLKEANKAYQLLRKKESGRIIFKI